MAKTQKKLKARELRKEGKAVTAIANELQVSTGTVSRWCRDIELTKEQQEKLRENSSLGSIRGTETVRRKRQVRQSKYQQEGRDIVGNLSDRELLLVGAALYWGEGDKNSCRTVGLSNSNPAVIQLCIRWLQKCLDVKPEQMRFHLCLHQGQNKKDEQEFWKQVIGFDGTFYKISVDTRSNKKKAGTGYDNYHGTIRVIVHDVNLFYKIEGMMQGLAPSSSG